MRLIALQVAGHHRYEYRKRIIESGWYYVWAVTCMRISVDKLVSLLPLYNTLSVFFLASPLASVNIAVKITNSCLGCPATYSYCSCCCRCLLTTVAELPLWRTWTLVKMRDASHYWAKSVVRAKRNTRERGLNRQGVGGKRLAHTLDESNFSK